MNMKEFTIGIILAVVIVTLGLNYVNDMTAGTSNGFNSTMNLSIVPLERKANEIISKINETSTSGVVSISGAYSIITMPISIVSLALESAYISFGLFVTMVSQITGLPSIFITAIFAIFAVWVAWEVIRLVWGRS